VCHYQPAPCSKEIVDPIRDTTDTLALSIEPYRSMLTVGISDPAQRRIVEEMLDDLETLLASKTGLPTSPDRAAFCTRPAFVHGAEMAESRGRQAVV
jgi:hypothetical protein